MIPHVTMESKKNTSELIHKQKQTHRYRKQTYGYQRRRGLRVKLD